MKPLVILFALLLAGCAASATPTATPRPTPTATVTPVLPMPGDGAAYGERLFRTLLPEAGFACITCHYPDLEPRLMGPGFKGLSQRIESYGLDQTIEEYLRESILDPMEFIAPADPAYRADLMPRNYAEVLDEQQLADLIVYLLTL